MLPHATSCNRSTNQRFDLTCLRCRYLNKVVTLLARSNDDGFTDAEVIASSNMAVTLIKKCGLKREEYMLPVLPMQEKLREQQGTKWCFCDTSSSMLKEVVGTALRRIDCVNRVIKELPADIKILQYDTTYNIVVERRNPLVAAGYTHLLEPLRVVAREKNPIYILVIGDGLVGGHDKANGVEAAECLEMAHSMYSTTIDTLYIGGADKAAERFMRQLATVGRGKYTMYDTTKVQQVSFTSTVAGLLGFQPTPLTTKRKTR